MIFKVMLEFDDFEDDAGFLTIVKMMLDFDGFENNAGF